jgi:two-component system C4-dicarboxylate transport sensor histidine kinase DctB
MALAFLFLIAVGTVWVTNRLLTDRFTETTQNRAELRLALYSGNLLSELRRNAIVPQLLARDPSLIGALTSNDYSQSSQRLISYVDEIGAASLMLLDKDGRTVAATDRNKLGENHRNAAYFVEAIRSNATVFTSLEREFGGFGFSYSRRIEDQGAIIGVIVVEVDLAKFERAWAGISDAVMVTNSEGRIILATEPRWRGKSVEEALQQNPAGSAIERAIQATTDWTTLSADAYVMGEAVMRVDGRIPFRGWSMINFTTYASVRERVNAVLALEIMAFALLARLWRFTRCPAKRHCVWPCSSVNLRNCAL